MEPHAFTQLGGLPRPTDLRDFPLGAVTSPTYTFPLTFTNQSAWAAPIEYQGKQPACGAHAGAKQNDLQGHALHSTPRFTWGNIKTFDGLPVTDGTTMRAIFRSVTKAGTLDFDLMGNDVTLDANTYANPIISAVMVDNAATHEAQGYAFAADLSFDGLKQYIYQHGPIILLVEVGNEWWTGTDGNTSWAEKDILPLRPPANIVSGHFIVAHSYDEQYIYFVNSWSQNWGRAGHGYFGADYLPYVLEAGTTISLAFSKNLALGMTDPEVHALQILLNKNPQTAVADTGPGSAGHETAYFGPLTKAAVIRFQTLHHISPQSGYVGPLTRAVLNTL